MTRDDTHARASDPEAAAALRLRSMTRERLHDEHSRAVEAHAAAMRIIATGALGPALDLAFEVAADARDDMRAARREASRRATPSAVENRLADEWLARWKER